MTPCPPRHVFHRNARLTDSGHAALCMSRDAVMCFVLPRWEVAASLRSVKPVTSTLAQNLADHAAVNWKTVVSPQQYYPQPYPRYATAPRLVF